MSACQSQAKLVVRPKPWLCVRLVDASRCHCEATYCYDDLCQLLCDRADSANEITRIQNFVKVSNE